MTQKVSKSSIKVSLFKLRRLVLALVFLFAAQGVWGAECTWTGAEDTTLMNPNNWEPNIPNSGDTIIISVSPLGNYPSVDPSLIDNIASVKIVGQLTLTGDFTLAKVDSDSSGTLIVNGKLINNSTNDVSSLAIQCTDFEVNGSLKCKSISMSSSSKIDGTLTIADDFTLSNIDTASTGTLIVKRTLNNSSNFEAANLSVVFNSYQSDSGWLKCKKITIDGTDTPSISGAPILVATTGDGINFKKSVEVNASSGQCVLAGDVIATSDVTITVTDGFLNHVNEGSLSSWSDKITVDLNGSDCTLGMQEGQSYKTKVTATSDNVYFVGNGTIASMAFPVLPGSAGCNIHFGNTDEDPEHANTITIGDDIEFNTTGGIVINKSCKGLIGSVTLLKINSITNESTQLTGAIEPTFSLNDSATISGSGISFAAITCSGNATISGTNTISKLTATGLSGNTLTINGTTTIGSETSLSGTDSSNLIISGSGSFTVLSDLSADYITLSATAPEVTGGTIYAQHSESAGTAPAGWVLSANALHVWKGGTEDHETDWATAENWLPASVPMDGDVIINATTNNPVISSVNISLNSITIGTGAKLTIAANRTLTLESGCELDNKIEGDGTLALSSGQTYTIPTGITFGINIENNGTLNSSGDGAVIVSKSFKNNNNGEATFSHGIQLAGNFTDLGTNFSGTVTLNGDDEQSFSNTGITTSFSVAINKSNNKKVDFKDALTLTSLTANSEYTGAITFSASGNQTFTPQSAVYQNITVNKSSGSLIVDGNLKVKTLALTDGEVTFNGNLTLTDGTNLQSVDLRNISDSITFSGGTALSPNVLTAASIQSSTKISADYLKLDGTTIQLTSAQNINHLTLKGSASVSVNGITAQTLLIDSSTPEINLSGTISLATTFAPESPVILTGDTTIDTGTEDVVFNGTVTSTNSPAGSPVNSLSITAANLTFDGNVSVKDLTINAVATTDKNITVSGNWTNSNSFTATGGTVTFIGENPLDGETSVILAGDNKFNSLVIQDSIQITGNNEIETLTANTLGGKQIIFTAGKIQTVNGKITLSGTANNNRLVLKSSSAGSAWTIKCAQTENNHDIKFVELLDSMKLIQAGTTQYNLFAFQSKDSGNNTNWSFPDMTYTWVGGASGNENSWTTKENWSPQVVPTKGSTVIIPDVSGGSGKYPSLTAEVDIKDSFNSTDYGTITVASNAEFDIAGQNLTAVSITNNGKVKLYGTQTIAATMSNGDSSTIEYYYTDNTTSLGSLNWDIGSSGEKKYTNLIISRNVSLTEKLNVTGKITINADANLDNANNAITSVKLGDYNSIQAGDVIIKTADAITLDDNAYAKSFDCYSAVNLKNITTSGTQTYRENVTLTENGNTKLTAKNALDEYQTIDFQKNILVSETGSKTLVLAANTTLSNVAASIAPNIQTQADTSFTVSSNTTTFKADVAFADNSFNANGGTVIFTGAATSLSGTNTFNNFTISDTAKVTTAANITVTGNWTNNNSTDGFIATAGTVIFTGANPSAEQTSVTLAGANKFYELKIQGPVTITGSNDITNLLNVDSGAVAINASLSLKDLLIANNANAKVTTNSDITVTGNWTNNNSTDGFTASGGTVSFITIGATADERKVYADLRGTNTFYNLSLNRCLNIHNDNTIEKDFTAIKPERGDFGNLKFAADTVQTVKGKLTIQGLGTGGGQRQSAACITENGTWKLKCEQTQNDHIIQYVNLSGCNNTSENYKLIARNSRDTGGNQKIVFLGLKYLWTGNTSDDWNDYRNWGSEFDSNGPVSVPEKGSTITIQKGRNNYPLLRDNLDLKLTINTTDYGTITIQAADENNVQGFLDLAGYDLTVETITNNGLVRLIGASAQTITGKMINGTGSAVEYYDTGATLTNFVWDGDGTTNGTASDGKQYANLILNQNTSGSDVLVMSENLTINNPTTLSGAVTVEGNLTIVEAATLSGPVSITGTTTIAADYDKTVTLNNDNNSFGGIVIIKKSDASTGAVTLKAASTITLANNANAVSLTIQSPVELQNVTTTGNQSYTGTVKTITGDAELKSTGGNISFANKLMLDQKTTITSGTGTIGFGNSATVDGAKQLILSSASGTTFGADVGNVTALSSLSVDGPLSVNCGVIKTSGNQSYNGTVTLVKDAIHLQSTSTTGTITFASTAPMDGTKELTISTTAGTTFNANVGNKTGTELAKLTVEGPLNINCEVVKTSGNQSYSGAVTLVHDTNLSVTGSTGTITFDSAATIDGTKALTLSTTAGTSFGANVGSGENKALTNLTITGPLTIKDNCTSITTKKASGAAADTTGIQTYNGTVTLNRNTTLNAENKILYKVDITQNNTEKTLTINSPEFTSTKTPGSSSVALSTINLARGVTLNSATGGGINLSVSSITQPNNSNFTLKNNANLSLTASAITITPAFENDTSGTLTASSGTTTFNSAVDLSEGGFNANNGTVVLTGTTSSGTSQSLTTKSDGTTSFNNLVIKGNVSINNSNTIVNLTAADAENDDSYTLGGKTITFGAGTTQTITSMTLKGTGTGTNLLTLTSSGYWYINCANEHVLDYLYVHNSTNNTSGTPAPGTNFVAYHSTDAGGNTYWAFPDMTYTWLGTTSTAWNETTNWQNGVVPTKGASVEIAHADTNKYPKLAGELNLNTSYGGNPVNGSITVNATAEFDLADQDLTVGTITNNGLVRLIGTSVTTPESHTQTITGKMINGTGSTVEYYSGTDEDPANFPWDGDGDSENPIDGKQYANLILNKETSGSTVFTTTGDLTINEASTLEGNITIGTNESAANLVINEAAALSGQLTVTGTTTIAAGSGKTVTLNNSSNVFTSTVKVGDSDETSPVNAGEVILKAASTITLANNANADSLIVNSPVQLQNVTTTGVQTYNGTVKTITGDAELKSTGGNISFADKLTLDQKTTITSDTGAIGFGNSATIDGGKQLLLSSASGTTFGADVGNSTALASLSVEGPLSVNCGVIKTSGNQSYNGAVTLVKDAILLQSTSATGTITFSTTAPIDGTKELTISTTAGTTFNASVGSGTGTELAKLTVAGPLDINCAEINTSGNQSYQGNVKVSSTQASLVSSAGDISFTNPDANVYGNKLILTVAADKTIVFRGTAGTQANPLAELNIVSASETIFEKPVYIGTFAETVDPGNITFKSGGNIVTSTQFHTTGNITLTDTLTLPSLQMNNLIIDETATIKTSGAQTYNGTINGKTASTDVLNLDSGSGHITFNGDIGQSLPPQTLNVTGETTINCEAITTSGTQTYNSAITLGTAPSPETHTLTASGISFALNSTIDSAANLIISTTDGTSFADNVGETTPLASLEVTGKTTIDCTAIKTSGDQHYKNAVALTASPTLTSTGGNLIFDSTIDGEQLLTLSVPQNTITPAATYTITVKGKVGETEIPSVKIAQAGNISFEDTVKTTNFTITKANDSTFEEQVDSSTFVITQADNTLFKKAVNVTGFTITTASTTTFNETVQISTFVDAATAGDITFKNSGTISTATEFKTKGTVTFGDAAADIMTFGTAAPYVNITHTAGDTSITGTLNAAAITLAQTAGGPMTILNTGLFKTVDGATLTYTTSFTQNGAGNSILGGSFSGNGNASFATGVQLYGSSQADFGAAGTNISIAKNLIIIREATDNLNIKSNVNVAENLVLYKGPVVAEADISVAKDILVLGSSYSETDTSTGITNEYAYDCVRPETWSQVSYTETLLPDGTATPGGPSTGSGTAISSGTPDFTSTLSVSSGKTISTAKNFYANGTTLSLNGTSGQWTLKVPDLTNAANAFAESYHSEISGCKVICSDNSADGSKARLVCLECADTATTNAPNTNVDFDDFEITAAWTERDNSIRVEFNRPVRYYNQTVQTLKFQNPDGAPTLNFTGLFSDPDCQTEIKYDTEMSYFYIKAEPQNDSQYGAWNTDATGRSSGADDDQSTDRIGIHHENIPALDFARALINSGTTQSFIFTDRWGKRLNNYSSRTPTAKAAYGSTADTDTTHAVADKTGPVLYSVHTGQELHDAYNPSTGQASEHSYDSHNFIEFVYSEKVDFDSSSDDSILNDNPAVAENVQVNDSLGAVKGDITKADNLELAGLGIIQNGLLYTGSNGSANKYVSALYRKGTNAEYAIRLSVAGYTDPTVTLTDDDGYTYKKWIGYIEQAKIPSGTVKHLVDSNNKNERVKDKDGNVQIKYANDKTSGEPVFDTIPVINSTADGLYGAWDLSEPVFALYRQNAATTPWAQEEFNKNYYAEAIGNNSGVGSTLDRIEFHVYDNTPDFTSAQDQPEWFTEVGWCNPGSSGEKPQSLYKSYTYAADIFGGARPFDSNAATRTSGGIRYSTIYSSVNAFKYGIGSKLSDNLITTAFDNSKIGIPGATSLIFTGASSPRRSAGDSEGLYFALPLENTSLDIKTSFTVKYDDSIGFITDLAGNRLRTKTFSTIDRTPPSIDMTVCPVGGDELEIIFVKELCVESDKLNFNDNSTGVQVNISEQYESLITECFDFITIDSSGNHHEVSDLYVDKNTPAKISIKDNKNGSSFTSIRLKLNRTVTLEDIKTKFIRIIYIEKYGEYSIDLFTGHPGSRVTFIQDEIGNNIQMYTAHAISDFAVSVINPLYAYDSGMTEDDGSIISDSLFRVNTTDDVDSEGWAVHDWNRDQQNYGTLPAKRPVAIVADTSDGSETNEDAPTSFRLYMTNTPDAASVSTQYNKDLEPSTEWRIWLPNETDGVFASLAEKNNKNYSQVDGTLLSDQKSNRLIFDVNETITNQWSAGNQITFLFGLTNSDGSPVTIMHSPELDINNDKQYLATSTKMPLFALRQTDPQDLLSLDLWSFRLKDVLSQRGGVTILNNVINASEREKVVVKVQAPEDGNLTVLVMTVDGNIVDYLHRGAAKAGEHFYSWDGTNRKGNAVARGMYFIRVTGPGIDETRKVMVVKE